MAKTIYVQCTFVLMKKKTLINLAQRHGVPYRVFFFSSDRLKNKTQ